MTVSTRETKLQGKAASKTGLSLCSQIISVTCGTLPIRVSEIYFLHLTPFSLLGSQTGTIALAPRPFFIHSFIHVGDRVGLNVQV